MCVFFVDKKPYPHILKLVGGVSIYGNKSVFLCIMSFNTGFTFKTAGEVCLKFGCLSIIIVPLLQKKKKP